MTRTQSLSLVACLGLAGCSSMTAGRPMLTQKPRTIVSSNDTAVALRDGPDRPTIDTELDEPEPPSRPDARISGRVVDDRGRAVKGAEVRLADGGARSGSDQTVTTDASGGFTLRNLRPGGSYTVVAEGSDGRGGRAEETSPGTRVTIRLGEEDSSKTASARVDDPFPPPRRTTRISGREAIDAEPDAEAEPPVSEKPLRRVNRDDLPPADEAEVASRPASSRPNWRKGATSDPAVATVEAAATSAPRNLEIPPKPAEPEPSAPKHLVEDVPNPLPPAKERPEPAEAKPATPSPDPNPSNELPPADKPPATNPPAANPNDPPPPSAPSTQPELPASPFSSAGDFPEGSQVDSSLRVETEPRKQATWGDLAAKESSHRLAENASSSLSTRRLAVMTTDDMTSRRAAQDGMRSGLAERLSQVRSGESAQLAPASCQFDARRNRLVDFRLPGLDGKPRRLQEMDADFVLIEFWETRSEPSRKTIPHLIELQEQYGKKTLRVVGVAGVRSPDFEKESQAVREAAEKLGINYTLLLSEADGKPCPLQEALNIKAYPTMILVDRSGQLLWRDTGGKADTLGSLDRVIAARTDAGVVRR